MFKCVKVYHAEELLDNGPGHSTDESNVPVRPDAKSCDFVQWPNRLTLQPEQPKHNKVNITHPTFTYLDVSVLINFQAQVDQITHHTGSFGFAQGDQERTSNFDHFGKIVGTLLLRQNVAQLDDRLFALLQVLTIFQWAFNVLE